MNNTINKNNDMPVDMSVTIAGVTLKNPIVTVSGTCGYGREYSPYYSPAEVGAVTVKALTLAPRVGNPTPRVAETPAGMLNAIGLQNPGVRYFIENELPRLRKTKAVIITNVAGSTSEEYEEVAEMLDAADVDMLELNISCPNVKEGGIAFGTLPSGVADITSRIKRRVKKPLIVKLSPNVSDISENARAAESAGADALSLINTLVGMRIDTKSRRPVLANNTGGLSGPAIFPVAVRMVWQVSQAVKIPIIGMGGVSSGIDAAEIMLAGAAAVGVGTAAFVDPKAPVKICDQLERYCRRCGVDAVSSLTGGVLPN